MLVMSDLVPREALAAWAKYLRTEHVTFLFRSASTFLPKTPINDPKIKGKAKETADDAIGADALLEHLGQCATVAQSEFLQVAVVGLTNVCSPPMSVCAPTPANNAQLTVWQICHREFACSQIRGANLRANVVYGCMEHNNHTCL